MSQADFARFLEIGTGSLFKVVSQSFVARKQEFFSQRSFRSIYERAEELSRMLSGLRQSLLKT